MDILKQIEQDEEFERRLAENLSLTPEQKKKRLAKLSFDGKAKSQHDRFSQRSDILEYPDDVPIMPFYGNTLPSKLFMKRRIDVEECEIDNDSGD